eukprot:TRINITY_DN2210_c0_g1_i2.p1 TRINITY_DN2210_c0_g1~~TRINITY_DN2210_c0_g1_i2.p1  ORF type:complete len:4545 (+),score=1094.61 TRINITY_DN2210_c0_g1_i2:1851-13637(+)
MKRVEDVLGSKWEQHPEGKVLKQEYRQFRKKLNPEGIFNQWIDEVSNRNFDIEDNILTVTRKGTKLFLDVNFDSSIIILFKEVRNFRNLGLQTPNSITLLSNRAKAYYPYAVALQEMIRVYNSTLSLIKPEFESLLDQFKIDVQEDIQCGLYELKWKDYKAVGSYVKKTLQTVQHLQEQTITLINEYNKIESVMSKLRSCNFEMSVLSANIETIQNVVDKLELADYSNLDYWIKNLNERIGEILLERLKKAVEAWNSTFEGNIQKEDENIKVETGKVKKKMFAIRRIGGTREYSKPEAIEEDDSTLSINKTYHEIIIKHQVIQLEPPIEYARVNLIAQFDDWLSNVLSLPALQGSRYDLKMKNEEADTYRYLLTKLPSGLLVQSYKHISEKVKEVYDYVQIWLQYQSLWDMDSTEIYGRLGEDLDKWQEILRSMKRSRLTFDNSENEKDFGSIVIRYKNVRSNVNIKYDYWHKEILNTFGGRLGAQMKDFYDEVREARARLEQQSLETASTAESVEIVIVVQEIKRKMPEWEILVENLSDGQNLLDIQRYKFPQDYLHFNRVESEWTSFCDILDRKSGDINEHLPSLQKKIIDQTKVINERIATLISEWNQDKPLHGNINHTDALETLTIFKGRVEREINESVRVSHAKKALDLDDDSKEDKLLPISEEIEELTTVWQYLSDTWTEIDDMKELPWAGIVTKKIRIQLEALEEKLKTLPNKIRQYAPYQHCYKTIQLFLEANHIITDLKSDAIKERHWRQLKEKLNVQWRIRDLTLGHIWDCDLEQNEKTFREVITKAQGEAALEEFLKDIHYYWQNFSLDLVLYKKKVNLIRGWDDIFTKLGENINSLSAMKNSPFYKVFEEDANRWESKLNRVLLVMDIWIDVQRRWVYLEGIFHGGSDIKHLLPRESAKFETINTEFLGLMREVTKRQILIDVLNIENIDHTIERYQDIMTKIQKALGEYLEKQRAAFPRFYFIGDEDLLEIIGNSNDIFKVQKHLKKMFSGINSLCIQEENIITGMISAEGEEVMFNSPIDIRSFKKIEDWLSRLEEEMRISLAVYLEHSLKEYYELEEKGNGYLEWISKFPSQIVLLVTQINFSTSMEKAIGEGQSQVKAVHSEINQIVDLLAEQILQDIPYITRRKYECIITEMIHQRSVIKRIVETNISNPLSFDWLKEMRFYFNESASDILERLVIKMADATFFYGYEYLGIAERLVQTPLTDKCYLTLTQALEAKMGGSPYGPAGTGKTETVKQLGIQLGRLTLVFCCDESFDFKAVSRIFIGLCECGAWGCFDEFNRLEERILSAVSQQIQTIQLALKSEKDEVELLNRRISLNSAMAIFVTMNPGYAGRSNLPDNLKQLFRGIAMMAPNREIIAEVMLYSQGFKSAGALSNKIVPLFKLCKEQLSNQPHYDFGLRSLKSVLVSSGNLQRHLMTTRDADADIPEWEEKVLIRSVCENVIPKLVSDDITLFRNLVSDVFPTAVVEPLDAGDLKRHIYDIAAERFFVVGEMWLEKMLQLFLIQSLRHGVMLVGPSGSGKSSAWKVLLEALERSSGRESRSYIIDPKAITKEELFGSLELTTREWTDGLFTHTLRKIIDNHRNESEATHWIIFDGDVDPEWVENLNALLDDNKILTLPNGERLALPNNVKIIFEVENLQYATLATVSRCGMIWFNEDTLSNQMIYDNYLDTLCSVPFEDSEKEGNENDPKPGLAVQRRCVEIIRPFFSENGFLDNTLAYAESQPHIMDFTRFRALTSAFSIIDKGIIDVIEADLRGAVPMDDGHMTNYMNNRIMFAVCWGFGGSMALKDRENFSRQIQSFTSLKTPDTNGPPLLDYEVNFEQDGQFTLWSDRVPLLDIETHQAGSPDVIIPTVDTIRHVEVLSAWLGEHKPLILCGPPGSGKTMTLSSTLRALPQFVLQDVNFSSATSPELILKILDHNCEYIKTPKGVVLRPNEYGRWLVIFCDEINLPQADDYGTQRVITFIRQMVEQNGFWRTSDHSWVTLERIQFVGACNPPTDPGRVPLSNRFLRYAPVLYVDFPSTAALHQIYGTFTRAIMKLLPDLRQYGDAVTHAMVKFYKESQEKFTPDQHAHYIYSPRELSRWTRAMHKVIKTWVGNDVTVGDLARLWAHEGLRLFQDRLVTKPECEWTDEKINEIAAEYFVNMEDDALERPILFSDWITKDYQPVDRETLRSQVQAKLRVFNEEELDVKLVIFNEVLDHILRIDRVFKQPQGHALLIGVSGGGKTVLSRFVAWMNGLSIFTIKVNNKYSAEDFDEDLRTVMKRSGCDDEKICFIFDESNVLESNFLERMNTLLASGEVPGLFEGEEYVALMHQIRDSVSRQNVILDTESELYRWFIGRVRSNLHIVFTMNPASPEFHNRAATSPALFNRCVLDWFGEWSDTALFQVGSEFTKNVDLADENYQPSGFLPPYAAELGIEYFSHQEAVVSSIVYIHQSIEQANVMVAKQQGRINYVTPRHFLDFINHVVHLIREKRSELEEQQLHINMGLQKLEETQREVQQMQESLAIKRNELEEKQKEAEIKLKQMIEEQNTAEVKKREAEELRSVIEEQSVLIETERTEAYSELDSAEPALRAAKQAVKGITPKHLGVIKSFTNPPQPVQKTLEAVFILLGKKDLAWGTIRKGIFDKDFIPSVVKFQAKSIKSGQRRRLEEQYFSDPNFNYDVVSRASTTCGPLYRWLESQLNYSSILHRVKPLKERIDQLETEFAEASSRLEELNESIESLEGLIKTLTEEYAFLIAQSENIKNEMSVVEVKVGRSISLLKNLSTEQIRWAETSQSFDDQMSTVIGNSVLAAAFIAYTGFFDQHYRNSLLDSWKKYLSDVGINYSTTLSLIDYLSHPDDRLTWHANDLPSDELAEENAIMLTRFNRYPLVIDPSGQATNFLMNLYADRKITKTSFLNPNFMKSLESALRFGTPLLVEDVESIDPVLNPVLNKEIHKTGGRTLIRLGDQDIDFSPSFVIFLATRDPNTHFTPDLCSRVTFVNFTVTPNSLQSQCLNSLLKSEEPEMYEKQISLLKMQGEFKVKLRNLEQSLLDSINAASGNLLNNDTVIAELEKIKAEAADITEKVEEGDRIMADIKVSEQFYLSMAVASSRIYFTLEQLSQVNFLYQYTLNFFLGLFHQVTSGNPALEGITDKSDRLEILKEELFHIVYGNVSRSLLQEDRRSFAMRLCQIKLSLSGDIDENLFDFLMTGGDANMEGSRKDLTFLDETQLSVLSEFISTNQQYNYIWDDLVANQSAWNNFLDSPVSEECVPESLHRNGSESISAWLEKLTILKCLRLDRLNTAVISFVNRVFGHNFLKKEDYHLPNVVTNEADAKSPLIFCCATGFDASTIIDDLAGQMNIRNYKAIALGSPEGFDLAEDAINNGIRSGHWVLLKNIHLAPQWLVTLEKKIYSTTPHPNFRLFMTSEIHPNLPTSLLRVGLVFVCETPPGVKANLQRTLSEIPASRMNKGPVERARLYFLMSWFHAIVQERLRYTPYGWTKAFEFSDTDKRGSFDTIDAWVDSVAKGKSNVDPTTIPWNAVRTLLGEAIYGGRIDNEFDQRLLESFLEQIFTPNSFDVRYPLVPEEGIYLEDCTNYNSFMSFIDQLPDKQTPVWLGLPANAELILLQNQAKHTMKTLLKMQTISDSSAVEEEGNNDQSSGRPAWMDVVEVLSQRWLDTLPKSLSPIDVPITKGPLYRCFQREIASGSKLLKTIRNDFNSLLSICSGETKQTNYTRALISDLTTGTIPKAWRKYTVLTTTTINAWIPDFIKRIAQLQEIRLLMEQNILEDNPTIWFGGLFNQEAFITATRQAAARANKWSLENLTLCVDNQETPPAKGTSFVLTNLILQGAQWEQPNKILLSDDMNTAMNPITLRWVLKADIDHTLDTFDLPFYLNDAREESLFSVSVAYDPSINPSVFYQRGAAIVSTKI